MAIKDKTFISKAELVAPDTESSSSITPDDGALVILKKFTSNLPPLKDANVCILWDFDGQDEEIVATQNINDGILIGTGDGSKELAIVLMNNETLESVVISGECLIEEITSG